MSPPNNHLLVVFSKNPVAGRVKTRLAASIGDEKALAIYEMLRGMTEKATANINAMRAVFYSEFIPENDLFLTEKTSAWLQEGNDLGERMHLALLKGFSLGFSRVALIGTDCPEMSPFIVNLAFRKLDTCDVVLGPALDGGFYLVGMKQPFPELFLERTWSTAAVLNESLRIIRKNGKTCEQLPTLSDIDTLEDLEKSGLWNETSG
jgi:uncharacterized protein